jgi:FkbM family methyltransferase
MISSFDYKSFISKYIPYLEASGKSRINFYDYIIPKLASKNKPLFILETGTMWSPLDKNMGAFTLIMGDLIKNHTGGKLYTVDISENNINLCKSYTQEVSSVVEYVVSDSVSFLRSLPDDVVNSFDLVYLDSYDLMTPSPHNSAQHHLDELTAIYPKLSKECGVAIDDNYIENTYVTWDWYDVSGQVRSTDRCEIDGNSMIGKGMYCNDFLLSRGWNRFKEFDIQGLNCLFYYENQKLNIPEEIDPIKSWRYLDKEKTLLVEFKKDIKNATLVLRERSTKLVCCELKFDNVIGNKIYSFDLLNNKSIVETKFSGFFIDIYTNDWKIASKELLVREIVLRDSFPSRRVKTLINFIGYTPDGKGIRFTSNNQFKKEVVIKIVDCFTGLVFHNQNISIIEGNEYFFSHAYDVPNQSFRIYDADYQDLLFEKIINSGKPYDDTCFSEENRNLNYLVPNELKNNFAIGFGFFEIFVRKTYEFENVKIRTNDIVFDIGANVGMFSRYAFQKGASVVHAFEPNKDLKKCYENLNAGKDYRLTNKAVSSFPVNFVFQQDLFDCNVKKSDSSETNVSHINILDYIKDNNVVWIDYLKVDIEGAEYDLFETLESDFLTNRVVKIALEYHNNDGKNLKKILDKLKSCGFNYKFEYSDGFENPLGMLYAINSNLYKNTKYF